MSFLCCDTLQSYTSLLVLGWLDIMQKSWQTTGEALANSFHPNGRCKIALASASWRRVGPLVQIPSDSQESLMLEARSNKLAWQWLQQVFRPPRWACRSSHPEMSQQEPKAAWRSCQRSPWVPWKFSAFDSVHVDLNNATLILGYPGTRSPCRGSGANHQPAPSTSSGRGESRCRVLHESLIQSWSHHVPPGPSWGNGMTLIIFDRIQ